MDAPKNLMEIKYLTEAMKRRVQAGTLNSLAAVAETAKLGISLAAKYETALEKIAKTSGEPGQTAREALGLPHQSEPPSRSPSTKGSPRKSE